MQIDKTLTWGFLFPWLLYDYSNRPKIEFAGLSNLRSSMANSAIELPISQEESFEMICIGETPNDFVEKTTRRKLTLGDMFSSIPEQASIAMSDSAYLSNSTKNLLLKHGWNKFYEFSSMFPSDIAKLSGGGKKFARELILTLLFEATNWFMQQGAANAQPANQSKEMSNQPDSDHIVERGKDLIYDFSFRSENSRITNRDLNEFLFKCSLLGANSNSIAEVLSNPSFEGLKSESLREKTVEIWFEGVSFPKIENLLKEFISTLEEKQKTVLLARASLSDFVTLDLVGEQLGVTRERARQLQTSYRKDFETFAYGEPVLSAHYGVFLDAVSGFAFVETMTKKMPFLSNPIENTQLKVVDFFVHMTAELEPFDGVISEIPKTKFTKKIREFLDEISNDDETHEFGYFLDKFREEYPKIDAIDVEQILRMNNFRPILQYWLNNKASGVQDLAVAVLKHEGKPLSPEDILEKIELDRNLNSFKNALLTDSRIQRTGLGKFGLSVWGLPVYTSIGEVIGEYIDSKGSTHIEQLVNYLTTTFEVTQGSVRAYASSYPFEIANGYVKRTNIKVKAKKPAHKVKNVFRDGESWLIRISVNPEILRGSGKALPSIFIDALGVSNKDSKTFTGKFGALTVTFPSLNLTVSSIKALCEEVGAADGDFVFISFLGSTFDFWRVDLSSNNVKSKILELVGYRNPSSSADLLNELRKRLSLDEKATAQDIRLLIEKRKESELLALMDSQPNLFN